MIRLFSHYIHWRTFLQVVFDFAIATMVAWRVGTWLDHGVPVKIGLVAAYVLILVATTLVFNVGLGAYQRVHRGTVHQTRARFAFSLYLAVPIAYAIFAAMPVVEMNQEFLEFSAMTAAFGLLSTRVVASPWSPAAVAYRILVLGVGERALTVERALRESDPTAEIVGFYPGANETDAWVVPGMILPRAKSLTDVAVQMQVDKIVVAVSERRGGAMPLRQLLDCRLFGIRVVDLESHFEQTLGQIRLDALYAGWLVFGDGFRQGGVRTVVKRAFDIACSLILLILAMPVMTLAALLILLEDGQPVLYRQERVGLNGRVFNVVKFRSMRADAEKDGRPRWAAAQDDRITRVGRVIRKLRIDELPQLFSVLSGDMSLVGPRPERPFFVDQLTREIPFYAIRHSIKPGVTGWAQVRYHYGATVEDAAEKLQYDLYYVKNHTLFLDLVVLFETVGVVLTGKGAN